MSLWRVLIAIALVCVACRTAPEAVDDKPLPQTRAELIEKLQAFISAHPEHPPFTPEAMFRLADLQTDAGEESGDYSAAIEVLYELTARFPDYEHSADAAYLLGFCLTAQGRFDQAREVFERFVDAHTDSPLISEVWLRLGEFAFDENRLDDALVAYAAALEMEGGKYRDKALYKLAWTHYRLDQYPEAIGVFRSLVEAIDRGEVDGALRSEAIEYIAIAVVEPDWDMDGQPDALCKPPEPNPWEACHGAPTSEIACRVHRFLDPKSSATGEVLGKAVDVASEMMMKEEAGALTALMAACP